jgi:hypothetical protein
MGLSASTQEVEVASEAPLFSILSLTHCLVTLLAAGWVA